MSDLSAGLEALAGRADIEGKAQRMQQFRADFKMVWGWYRHAGHLSQPEYEAEFAEAGQWVKDRIAKPEIGPVMDAYRTRAAQIEADRARSERIAAEVRAEKAIEKARGKKHG